MGFKEKLTSLKEKLIQLKTQGLWPKKMGKLDKILVSFVLMMMTSGLTCVGGALIWIRSEFKQSHVSSVDDHGARSIASENDHGETHDEHSTDPEEHSASGDVHGGGGEHGESGHGDSETAIIGGSDIPKSIKKRQDGEQEPDYDLKDPEIKQEKGLMGMLEKNLEVSVGSRTVEVSEIVAGSRMGNAVDANVYLDVVFEVQSFDAQKELEAKKTEIHSMIGAMVGYFSAEQLKSPEGKDNLKNEIFTEIRRLMTHGNQVTDVFFTNLVIR